MGKYFEKKMMCKNCNQVEIGKADDGKWYEVNNDTQLHFFKCAKRKDEKGNVDAQIKRLTERVESIETAVKALVATSGGQEVLG